MSVPCLDGSGSIQSPVYQLEESNPNGSNPPSPTKFDPSSAPSKALLPPAATPATMPACAAGIGSSSRGNAGVGACIKICPSSSSLTVSCG